MTNPFKLNKSPEELKLFLKEWAKVKEKELKEEKAYITEAEKIFL